MASRRLALLVIVFLAGAILGAVGVAAVAPRYQLATDSAGVAWRVNVWTGDVQFCRIAALTPSMRTACSSK